MPNAVFWPLAMAAFIATAASSSIGHLVPKQETTLASVFAEVRAFKPCPAFVLVCMLLAALVSIGFYIAIG